MAFRYFPGKDQAWLETQLSTAVEERASGAVIMSGGTGDANYNKQIQTSVTARIKMILHDLNLLDPTDYPADMVNGPTRVRATFNTSG